MPTFPLISLKKITIYTRVRRGLYTWTSPDGQYPNQIDCIIDSRRWRSYSLSAQTRGEADCGTDHKLLTSNIRIKLKKSTEGTKVAKYNINNIPNEFTAHIKNRFALLNLIDQKPELWTKTRNITGEE